MAGLIFNNGSVRIGYNGVPWSFSDDPNDVFMHICEPTTREVGSFRQEAVIAAREISWTFPDTPLYAMFSGGVDSEAMMEAFRLAKVPVTAVLIEFTDGSNAHDLEYAYHYLKRELFSDRVMVLPFDIQEWLKSDACLEMGRATQTTELIYTPLFEVSQRYLRDGIMMTAHEEPSLWRQDEGGTRWVFNRHERHYSLHKYFIQAGLSGIPSFFQWSTELMASFMFNKHYVAAYNGLYNSAIWYAEQIKYGFYFDEFGLRQRPKYTGFEKLTSEIVRANERWLASLPFLWNRELETEVWEWARAVNYRRQK